ENSREWCLNERRSGSIRRAVFFISSATVVPHSKKPVPSSRERTLGFHDPSATSRLRPSTLRIKVDKNLLWFGGGRWFWRHRRRFARRSRLLRWVGLVVEANDVLGEIDVL